MSDFWKNVASGVLTSNTEWARKRRKAGQPAPMNGTLKQLQKEFAEFKELVRKALHDAA